MDKGHSGILIVLSGASGTGKDTVIRELLKKSDKFSLSVSATTRQPRKGERDGADYFFIKREEFLKKAERGEFLEYAEYCGNFYGTPKDYVFKMLEKGTDVILEIEVDGGSQIKTKYADAVSIFIVPPSVKVLKERLSRRGLDNDKVIEKRLSQSEKEIRCAANYDYIVINDSLEQCAKDILKILEAERMKSKRLSYIIDEVLNNE